MDHTVRLLRVLRFWNQTPDESFPILGYLIIGIYLLAWIIPSCVFMATSQADVTLLLKAAAEQIVFFTIFYKLASFAYNFRRWDQMFVDLQQAFDSVQSDPHAEVQAILSHVRKVAYYLTRYYCSILTFNCMLYGLFPMVFVAVKYAVTGTYSVPLSTPIEANYFIPGYQSNFLIWLPFNSVLNAILLLHGLVLFAMECFTWIMIYDIASFFRILRIKAGQLGATEGSRWAAEIERFVSLHDCTLRCAAVLEETLAGQMLFLYLSTIFSLCLMMTVISIAFKKIYLLVTMLCVIGYCMFQTFCFSILGTELIEESEAVATAIFQSSWYARSNQQQRDLSFVMARAQRPVKLTAAKLFIVTRISFTQMSPMVDLTRGLGEKYATVTTQAKNRFEPVC
uniref:Uncharacterized protein n=1 Tax=Anopheles atroparvus TaxID=41427 RepID=A0A182IUW4_ANOAO